MALKVAIQQSKDVALWCEYKDEDGSVLAEFKVRGDGYKAYRVAVERANNQIASNGFDVLGATADHKLYHELLLQAAACHLIEDWKSIEFKVDGEFKPIPYTPENACQLLEMGDIGPAIWVFVKQQAHQIQKDADESESEVLGKSENSTSGNQDTVD